LKGLSSGHALLNLVPATAFSPPPALACDDASRIAQLEFCLPSKSFGTSAAAIIETAAVQRGWRDFRMAQ
jgi:hypothetical protein